MYTLPEHIIRWNQPSPDWHTPRAENDLNVGGRFLSRMEARDGSAGFDFCGSYTEVRKNEHLSYVLDDERKVGIDFLPHGTETKMVIAFEPESENPPEFQQAGWQSILDNFKKYVEEN